MSVPQTLSALHLPQSPPKPPPAHSTSTISHESHISIDSPPPPPSPPCIPSPATRLPRTPVFLRRPPPARATSDLAPTPPPTPWHARSRIRTEAIPPPSPTPSPAPVDWLPEQSSRLSASYMSSLHDSQHVDAVTPWPSLKSLRHLRRVPKDAPAVRGSVLHISPPTLAERLRLPATFARPGNDMRRVRRRRPSSAREGQEKAGKTEHKCSVHRKEEAYQKRHRSLLDRVCSRERRDAPKETQGVLQSRDEYVGFIVESAGLRVPTRRKYACFPWFLSRPTSSGAPPV